MIELRTGERRAAFDVPFNVYDAHRPTSRRCGRISIASSTRHAIRWRATGAVRSNCSPRIGTAGRRPHRGRGARCLEPPARHAPRPVRLLRLRGRSRGGRCAAGSRRGLGARARRRRDRRQLQSHRDADGRRPDRGLRARALHRHDVVAAAHRAPARARRLCADLPDDDVRDRPRRSVDPAGLVGPKQAAILADSAYTWQPIRRRDFKASMEDARVVLNDGFDRNPMFVPVTPRNILSRPAR